MTTAPEAAGPLRVEDLHYRYPGWPPTLVGAALEVPAGTSAFLLGPSGSGKSTLLRCIAGLEEPQSGRILWGGERLDLVPTHRRRVGMLFQEPALFPHLRVWRNVAFGLRYRPDAPRGWARRRWERDEAARWLELVQVDRLDARVDELSGGQRQRVALARTLAAKPRIVLLDEPFSGLDRDLRDELGPKVKDLLAAQGVAALWVTHDRDEAHRLGDRVWRMVDGRCEPLA
jgi:ABC-type sulfate/molybdate transport systems ATPase subunit